MLGAAFQLTASKSTWLSATHESAQRCLVYTSTEISVPRASENVTALPVGCGFGYGNAGMAYTSTGCNFHVAFTT